jgi:hypothetical protein
VSERFSRNPKPQRLSGFPCKAESGKLFLYFRSAGFVMQRTVYLELRAASRRRVNAAVQTSLAHGTRLVASWDMAIARACTIGVLVCVSACSEGGGETDESHLGSAGSASEVGVPSCEEQSQAAAAYVARAVEAAQADLSCGSDEDCELVSNSSDCYLSCGVLVSRQGAQSVRAAVDTANAEICDGFVDRGCVALAPPCMFPGFAACVNGACADFVPEKWRSFSMCRDCSPHDSMSVPSACPAGQDCTLWILTPDANITVTRQGDSATATLSAEDFATVDGILRSMSFRQSLTLGFTCDTAPSNVDVSIEYQVQTGGTIGASVTGCALSGPEGNDVQRLFELLQTY